MPKEPTPIVVAEEEISSEERGGFEAYSEQLVLSPTTDKAASTPAKVEDRGKRRAAVEEISTTELLSLLKEMKEEVRERDEQIREELRWRNIHLDEQLKKRENTLTTALQQRDDEWR